MDWHPQVHQEHAKADGRKPEDFQFEQWPLANVRIEPSTTRQAPFWYVCDIHPDTPLDNQYDEAGNKVPDPVGMCLQSVEFVLYAGETKVDEQDSLPTDGTVWGAPRRRAMLWSWLTPGTSLNVRLMADPEFYFLNEKGGMVGYSNRPNGQFLGARVQSPTYVLMMDNDGNVTVAPPMGIEGIIEAARQVWESGEGLTAEGMPRVDALEAILGYDITMAERDAAWQALKEGQ